MDSFPFFWQYNKVILRIDRLSLYLSKTRNHLNVFQQENKQTSYVTSIHRNSSQQWKGTIADTTWMNVTHVMLNKGSQTQQSTQVLYDSIQCINIQCIFMCTVFHIDIPIILYDSEKANREEDRPVAPKFLGWKRKGSGEFLQVMEVFYILIILVVAQLNVSVKIHRLMHWKR